MCVENTELHAPRHRQVLDVREIDLIEGAVIPTGIVAIGHDPLFWILLQRQQTLVSMCDAGNAQTENDRQDRSPHSAAICRSTHASPPILTVYLFHCRKQYYSGISFAIK